MMVYEITCRNFPQCALFAQILLGPLFSIFYFDIFMGQVNLAQPSHSFPFFILLKKVNLALTI